MKDKKRLLRIGQAAERLAVCTRTVRRLIYEGDLKAVKVRGGLRVIETSVDLYIDEQQKKFEIANGV